MSSIRLKTKHDIKNFFKILAEESVKEARSQILDPKASDLEEKSRLDKKAFGSITEEEEEGEEEFSITTDDPAGIEDISVSASEEEEAVSPAGEDVSIEDVSLDQINKKIKIMRSGLSVDDTSVQQPMSAYFDLLSGAERKALYAFINAIASIMTGTSSAEDADDPSEPPYNVQMSTQGAEEEGEVEVDISSGDVEASAEFEEEEEPESDMPIRVGGVQAKKPISEIRQKVLDLLGKS